MAEQMETAVDQPAGPVEAPAHAEQLEQAPAMIEIPLAPEAASDPAKANPPAEAKVETEPPTVAKVEAEPPAKVEPPAAAEPVVAKEASPAKPKAPRGRRGARKLAAASKLMSLSPRKGAPKRRTATEKRSDMLELIQSRRKVLQPGAAGLFRSEQMMPLEMPGDVRYVDCTVTCPFGPYKTGDRVDLIDWIGTANLAIISQSGSIADARVYFVDRPSSVVLDH